MLRKVIAGLIVAAIPQQDHGPVAHHPLQVCRPINPTIEGPTTDLDGDPDYVA